MWTVQVDDLVGGWIVTTYPHPLSAHDTRSDGDPTKRGEIIADCHSRDDGELIAGLLNERGRQGEFDGRGAARPMALVTVSYVRTDNDFGLGANAAGIRAMVPLHITTQQQAYRVAAYLLFMADGLAREDPASTFGEVNAAIRNT